MAPSLERAPDRNGIDIYGSSFVVFCIDVDSDDDDDNDDEKEDDGKVDIILFL